MTDAHCHVSCGDPSVREFLVGRDFVGVHPWETADDAATESADPVGTLRERLAADPRLGVGEIGLDRLKDRNISPRMRETFERQLRLAAEFRRSVVLHGAKCWGQVVATIDRLFPDCRRQDARPIPAFLFHGFSRSDGLIPDIVALNGYVSVGPALLNDHAANYRELAKKIPRDRLLVETDRTEENAAKLPPLAAIVGKLAEFRGIPPAELVAQLDANADAFANAGLG